MFHSFWFIYIIPYAYALILISRSSSSMYFSGLNFDDQNIVNRDQGLRFGNTQGLNTGSQIGAVNDFRTNTGLATDQSNIFNTLNSGGLGFNVSLPMNSLLELLLFQHKCICLSCLYKIIKIFTIETQIMNSTPFPLLGTNTSAIFYIPIQQHTTSFLSHSDLTAADCSGY